MRPAALILPLALSLSALPLTTHAQQATPPTAAPMAAPPAPLTSASRPALGNPPLSILSVPAPPGGRLRVEMDARSEDVLGVLKSFLRGIGETNGTSRAANPSRTTRPSPVADALEGGDLADMLRDVNHIHFVVYEMPGAATPTAIHVAPKTVIKTTTKKGVKTQTVTLVPPPTPTPAPAATPAFDSNTFYESAFAAEGAHRIMFADADDYKLVMVGFPNRQGYAFAVSGGGYVAVSRTDGYPNLEALTAFLSRATDAALRSEAMRKVMKDGSTPVLAPKPAEELGRAK